MTGKKRLHTEREKVRHTTHWDLDYLPKEEVERYHFEPPAGSGKTAPQQKSDRSQHWLGFALIVAGAALFACAVLLGRYYSG